MILGQSSWQAKAIIHNFNAVCVIRYPVALTDRIDTLSYYQEWHPDLTYLFASFGIKTPILTICTKLFVKCSRATFALVRLVTDSEI